MQADAIPPREVGNWIDAVLGTDRALCVSAPVMYAMPTIMRWRTAGFARVDLRSQPVARAPEPQVPSARADYSPWFTARERAYHGECEKHFFKRLAESSDVGNDFG